MDMIAALIFLLAVFTPTLAFCSVNTQFFTNRQILLSMFLSFAVGAGAGCLGGWLANIEQSACISGVLMATAAGIFCILHERFFSESIKTTKYRIVAICGILALSFLIGILSLDYILLIILAIFGIFSAFDLIKNWNRAKTPVFAPEKYSKNSMIKEKIKFTTTPNVYLLLLESMHSSKALKTIYDIDENGAEEILSDNNFTIYPDTFSNKHSTPLSLQTLLSLSLDYNSYPNVIKIFSDNGYKCNFFDTMYYLSQPYRSFIDNGSAALSRLTTKLYEFFGPFLSQSKFIRNIINTSDPFATENDTQHFNDMRDNFLTHLTNNNNTKNFNILHFGARHSNNIWYKIRGAANTYMGNYKTALEQMSLIINDIITRDKGAVIVAVGDHGAYRWNGAQAGKGSPEEALAEKGISTETFVHDFFGVILGIRWGALTAPAITSPLSHVNIFRWVAAALAGEESPKELSENISILYGNYIAARDGKPLEKFQPLQNKNYSDFYDEDIPDAGLLQLLMEFESKVFNMDYKNIDALADNLCQAAMISRPISLQHYNAAQDLILAGRIKAGLKVLDMAWNIAGIKLGYSPFIYLLSSHMDIGNYARANELVNWAIESRKLPLRNIYLYKIMLLWNEEKYKDIISTGHDMLACKRDLTFEPIDKFPIETTMIHMAIEAEYGHAAAIEWIDSMLATKKDNREHSFSLLVQKLVLMLKYRNEDVILYLKELIHNDEIVPWGFTIIYLALLIKYNKLDEAKSLLNNSEINKYYENDLFFDMLAGSLAKKGTSAYLKGLFAKVALIEELDREKLFDAEWFVETYGASADDNLLANYLKFGLVQVQNPNKDFNMHFYLCAYPAALANGIHPLLEYISKNKYQQTSPGKIKFLQKTSSSTL